MNENNIVIYDSNGRPMHPRKSAKVLSFAGFQGAQDESLKDWAYLPLKINEILRNDLPKLRARSRDLARNDDSCRRFLEILKQNVLGADGIKLQAKNRLRSKELDQKWNEEIEREWKAFSRKRRRRGCATSPSACGQMSLREISWLTLWNKAIDGECFIHILHGYKHNPHRFAVRFLNPDMLDSSYTNEHNGNRVEMGIEFDDYERPVAYHFTVDHPVKKYANRKCERVRIPASQIIHDFRREFVGQVRGIPAFAGIMKKAKMLNGVHEAIVVGWRVAASKMGFFTTDENYEGEPLTESDIPVDVAPGALDLLPAGVGFEDFSPEYPSSTYAEGYKTFMRQIANGLNISSPTLSNDYSDVNYSSLRQALLEDRAGWRCIQAEMTEGFYQPLFDEWYDWTANITARINITTARRKLDPVVEWQPRGWTWVDPLKEVKGQVLAINANLRTRQQTIADISGGDFIETADVLKEEQEVLEKRGLNTVVTEKDTSEINPPEEATDE